MGLESSKPAIDTAEWEADELLSDVAEMFSRSADGPSLVRQP